MLTIWWYCKYKKNKEIKQEIATNKTTQDFQKNKEIFGCNNATIMSAEQNICYRITPRQVY